MQAGEILYFSMFRPSAVTSTYVASSAGLALSHSNAFSVLCQRSKTHNIQVALYAPECFMT